MQADASLGRSWILGWKVDARFKRHAEGALHLRDCDWGRAFPSAWRPSNTVAQGTSDQTLAFHPVTRPQPLLDQEAFTYRAQ